jgi:hypothetical protein
MNIELQAKREELKAISAGYRVLVKEGAINSINEGLAKYYASQGHTTLKSYRRWKADGYQVRKGSKALLMWGEPKNIKHQDKEPPKENEDEGKADFYPVAYVFSNLQVDKM